MSESLIKKEPVARIIAKKEYNKSNLIYNNFIFYSYSSGKKFDSLSCKSKYSCQLNFSDDFEKLIKMKPRNLTKKNEKKSV